MTILEDDSSSASITLYLPEIITDYIFKQNPNRSQWIKKAGEDFLTFIKTQLIDDLDASKRKRKIVSISKPGQKMLRDIYFLSKNNSIVFSRSEFYRTSIFFRIFSEKLQIDLKERKEEEANPNSVKVPDLDENGDHVFRTYKILKKLDF